VDMARSAALIRGAPGCASVTDGGTMQDLTKPLQQPEPCRCRYAIDMAQTTDGCWRRSTSKVCLANCRNTIEHAASPTRRTAAMCWLCSLQRRQPAWKWRR
jgi:hypothetical protein